MSPPYCTCGHHFVGHLDSGKCTAMDCPCTMFRVPPSASVAHPLPSSANDTARRAQLRAELLAWVAIAPMDEMELLVELARRIESGRKAYGVWDAAKEKRDLIKEEHEEHLDAIVYSSMRRVKERQSS